MTITVQITDTQTGETRTYQDTWEDERLANFMFADGNYACDCNRALCFERVVNPDFDKDVPCGHTRYLVTLIDAATGEIIFTDDFRVVAS